MPRALAFIRHRSSASATTASRSTGHRVGHRLGGLNPGQRDQVLDQEGQPRRLLPHPAGEPADRLRVIGRVLDRLREQGERAHRRLELVAHVGDEVPADLFHPAPVGLVLREHQHQPAAADGPGSGATRTAKLVVRPPKRGTGTSNSASRISPSLRTCLASAASSLTMSRSPLTMPNARAAALARSTRSSLSTTTAEEERTARTDAIPGGSLAGCCAALSRALRGCRTPLPARVLIAMPRHLACGHLPRGDGAHGP